MVNIAGKEVVNTFSKHSRKLIFLTNVCFKNEIDFIRLVF